MMLPGMARRQRGPILKRRRFDVATGDFPVAYSHPVKKLAPWRFDCRQSLCVSREWHGDKNRSRRKFLQRFIDQAH